MTIVVLGAGASGLTAAWDLVRHQIPVIVIEKEARPGGLCQTFEKDGFRFDLGGHRFITKNRELEQEMLQLLGEDLLKRRRKSVILFEGHEFAYPLKIEDILQNLGLKRALVAGFSYLKNQWKTQQGRLDTTTFEGWARSHFGDDLYHKFFGPYTLKLWGIEPSKLSSDWAGQRISLMNLTQTLLHLLHLSREKPRTYALEYYYPRQGIGQMFQRMADSIQQCGGKIYYNTELKSIRTEFNQIRSMTVSGPLGLFEIEAKGYISTIPLPRVIQSFDQALSAEVQDSCEFLKYRALRCLNLLIDQESFGDITWRYVADGHRMITRIQEPKQRSLESAPPGKTSLMLEIPCNEGDEFWSLPEEKLLPRAFRELKELGFDIESKLLGFFSTRTPHAYPLFRVGYELHRKRLLDFLQPFSNFSTCGRQGTFRYIFQDTAQLMGRCAAKQWLENGSTKQNWDDMDRQSELQEIQATTA